jgi:hypothetical protein
MNYKLRAIHRIFKYQKEIDKIRKNKTDRELMWNMRIPILKESIRHNLRIAGIEID